MHWLRYLIAVVVALFGIGSYYSTTSDNPITGEKQRVRLSPDQEVALGRQMAPQMAAQFGLRLALESAYDPRAMIAVMRTLEKASGGGRQPEFASTHPNPGNRIEHIKEELAKLEKNALDPGEVAVPSRLTNR